jgi:2-polyprenyl-6-hydroxyphenyl methylase/3-demethylubiquinone-9 3-methyltransferase
MTINADPQELAKFGELAHRWWDPESDFKPLHQINPLRLGWIQQLCPLAGKRVVDVGCGGGILSDSMARAGAQVLGIDLSTKPLRVAELCPTRLRSCAPWPRWSSPAAGSFCRR